MQVFQWIPRVSRIIGWWLIVASVTALHGESNVYPAVRLRIEWSGNQPKRWNGLLEMTEGSLERPRSLGLDADEPGSFWIDRGVVWFQRKSAGVYNGFDVTAMASSDAELILTLQTDSGAPVQEQVRIAISELYQSAHVETLPASGTRLVLRRAPGDALRLRMARDHRIYQTGETFAGTLELNVRTKQPRQFSGCLQWSLTKARTDEVLRSEMRILQFRSNAESPDTVPVEFELPNVEGAYDIRFQLAAPGIPDQDSAVQVLVMGEKPVPRLVVDPLESTQLVDQFDPQDAGFLRRIHSTRRLKLLDRPWDKFRDRIPSLFDWNRDAEAVLAIHGSQAEVDRIPSDASSDVNQWQALRLRVEHPGRPHQLVVHVNRDKRQTVGISLLEPNAAGQLMPIGLDSVFCVPGRSADALSHRKTDASPAAHRLTFWPRVEDPVLLLHDAGSGIPLQVGRVELYELSESESLEKSPKRDTTPSERRLVGPYMHKPLLPECFGATETFDAASHRSLDDWDTFHAAGLRLVSYLKTYGYNSLLLAALADGSTIYPSRYLEPTPRYDSGPFFSTGQDPVRKDVLEFLYRLFDREGLVLIPELQFSTPLPVLERLRNSNSADAVGIELIDANGYGWREVAASRGGCGPYYNPLNPHVQDAVAQVVREVVTRYQDHPAFGGIAVELSSSDYVQLSSLQWGYDDATVAQFEKQTGIRIPNVVGDDPNANRFQQRYAFLTGTAREAWIEWRCRQMSHFYQRLAALTTQVTPSARLILSGNRLLDDDSPTHNLLTTIRSGERIDDLLRQKGLDTRHFRNSKQVTVLRPVLWTVPGPRTDGALEETLNRSWSLDHALAGVHQGCLLYRLPKACRVHEFDAISPWQPAHTWLAGQPAPYGLIGRRQWAHALASLDATAVFDGGWMVPFGQETETTGIRTVMAALPTIPFFPSDAQQQPLIVRVGRTSEKTYVYAVNDFSHQTTAEIRLACPTDTIGRMLGPTPSSFPLRHASSDETRVKITLEPFDAWACEVDSPMVRVVAVDTKIDAATVAELRERLQRVEQSMARLQTANQVEHADLQNPGFETIADDQDQQAGYQLPGWDVPTTTAAFWTVDQDNARSGRSALMLVSNSQNAAVLSRELSVQDNRHVTLSVWLKSDRQHATTRLAFQATIDGETATQSADVEVNPQWRRYTFHVSDIPTDHIRDAKIRVELLGPGRLWIDDVDIQMNRLTPTDVRQLTKVFAALSLAWQERQYADCERMLDGYWCQLLVREQSAPPPPVDASKPRRPSLIPKLFRK